MADPETIYNWRRLDDRITTSGQPTEPQLADIHALGVRHIVNLGLNVDVRHAETADARRLVRQRLVMGVEEGRRIRTHAPSRERASPVKREVPGGEKGRSKASFILRGPKVRIRLPPALSPLRTSFSGGKRGRSAETTRDDPHGEYLKRSRWFESGSLQRRVRSELLPVGIATGRDAARNRGLRARLLGAPESSGPGVGFEQAVDRLRLGRNGTARPPRHDDSPRAPVFRLERLNLTVPTRLFW
jgi:hypothetical protein